VFFENMKPAMTLWYRLAALGKFAMVEQCLYRGRITRVSISSLSRDQQVAYARLSHKAIGFRLGGRSDVEVVQEAERLLPRKSHRRIDQCHAIRLVVGRDITGAVPFSRNFDQKHKPALCRS
jgi:hypothetical protein